MGGSKTEVARVTEALNRLVKHSGLSRREVERRLLEQGCGTDLGRLLSGRQDLKIHHLLAICHVVGIYPLEFFRMVFKEAEERSPFLQRLDGLVGPGRIQRATRPPESRSAAAELDQMQQRLAQLLRQLETLTATLAASRGR